VAELQFLVAKNWATEPQVQRAAARLLGDAASANKLFHGTPDERKTLAVKLEPREARAK
jgi:hypothetical protein